jgi:hypothetical protein
MTSSITWSVNRKNLANIIIKEETNEKKKLIEGNWTWAKTCGSYTISQLERFYWK